MSLEATTSSYHSTFDLLIRKVVSQHSGEKSTVISNPAKTYEPSVISLPEYDVNETLLNPEYVQVTLDLGDNDDYESIHSYRGGRIEMKKNTFVHDFVFTWLAGDETSGSSILDKPLSTIACVMDSFNDKTPDIVFYDMSSKSWIVVEFTTSRGSEKSMQSAYVAKYEKYVSALQARAELIDSKIIFVIIVVGRNYVVSNVSLPSRIVTELCARMRLAIDMKEKSTLGLGETKTEKRREVLTNKVKDDFKRLNEICKDNPLSLLFKGLDASKNKVKNIDHDYVKTTLESTYVESAKEMLKDSKESLEGVQESQIQSICKQINACMSNSSKGFGVQDPKLRKTIVQLPLIVPSRGDDTIGIAEFYANSQWMQNFMIYKNSDKPLLSLLAKVIDKIMYSMYIHDMTSYELEKAYSHVDTDIKEEMKVSRSKWHRADISSMCSDAELAHAGLHKKRLQDIPMTKIKHIETKKTLHPETSTSHVNEFIDRKDVYEKTYLTYYEESEVQGLIKDSLELHIETPEKEETSEMFITLVQSICTTKLGRFSKFVSDLAGELAASFKQWTKKSEFIVKKMRNFNIIIIISTSHLYGNIQFSLLTHKSEVDVLDDSKVFRQMHNHEDYLFTDFVSIDANKIDNWIRCESMFLTLYGFWADFYGIKLLSNDRVLEQDPAELNGEAMKMLNLSMLILLENKAKTEEVITNSRYIIMEGFVSFPSVPKPEKMIEKVFSAPIRSCLQLYVMRVMKSLIIRIKRSQGFKLAVNSIEEFKSGKVWLDLVNPYTEGYLDNPHQLVKLMYIGYLKDKNETNHTNALTQLIEKIVSYEDRMPENRDNLYGDDPSDIKRIEWSGSLLGTVINYNKNCLQKTHGKNFMNQIYEELINDLSYFDLETFATLKSSSSFDVTWEKFMQPPKRNGRPMQYSRKKVAEAIMKLLTGDEFLVSDCMVKATEIVKSDDCLRICLFKKQQHGGLREIYVLSIEDRVLQFIIERMARILCNLFPSETMSHPENKTRIPQKHGSTMKKKCGSAFVTIADSADAEKWNQGHFVPKFAYMLKSFYPDSMHNFIDFVCDKFTKKKMMIDPKLQEVINSANYEDQPEGVFKTMCGVQSGKEQGCKWMKKGDAYITTESGMMQGILHFTSSVWHTLYLEYFKGLMNEHYVNLLSKDRSLEEARKYVSSNIQISSLQSSDDSSLMVSFPTTDENLLRKLLYLTNILMRQRHKLAVYLGIYNSIKSTTFTPFVMEFNSEFYFGTDHFRPSIRWLCATQMLSEAENICARQEEMSSNLSAALSGGCSFLNLFLAQVGQALLNYRTLGFSSDRNFIEYAKLATYFKDPGHGYFLMSNPFAAGLMGFRYDLWVHLRNSNLSILYNYLLGEVLNEKKKEDCEDPRFILDVLKSGAVSSTLTLVMTSSARFKALVRSMNLPSDWAERVENEPAILYKRPTNNEELKIRLAVKLHSPGVAESLSSHMKLMKTINSSVFILTRHCLTDKSLIYTSNAVIRKYTLIGALSMKIKKLEGETSMGSSGVIKTLIPQCEEFEGIYHSLSRFRLWGAEMETKLKRKNIAVNVTLLEHKTLFPPETLARMNWFPDESGPPVHYTVLQRQWEIYKGVFPWLSDDIQTTLSHSPFRNHRQLRNFLSRMDISSRTIVISGVVAKSVMGQASVASVIMNNFMPGFRLDFPVHDDEELNGHGIEKAFETMTVRHCLKLICNSMLNKKRKQEVCEEIIRNSNIRVDDAMGNSRLNRLAIMCEAMKAGRKIDTVTKQIIDMKAGVIGYYSKKSKKNKQTGEYYGTCEWTMKVEGKVAVITFDGNVVTKVLIQSGLSWDVVYGALVKSHEDIKFMNEQPKDGVGIMNHNGIYYHLHVAGTPIFVKDKINFTFPEIDSYKLLVTENRIILKGILIDDETFRKYEYNVLSFKFHESDISLKVTKNQILEIYPGVKDNMMSWLLLEQCELNSLRMMINNCISDVKSDNWDMIELSKYFKSAAQYRLIDQTQTDHDRSVFSDPMDFFQNLLGGITDDLIDEVTISLNSAGLNDEVGFESFFNMLGDVMPSKPEKPDPDYKALRLNHPWILSFMNTLTSIDVSFFKNLSKNKIHQGLVEMKDEIEYVFEKEDLEIMRTHIPKLSDLTLDNNMF